ncbi:MAG: DUF4424 family protein [Myxococcales bacterium]|nr:DUF4424 family protein [Myxococcales bacterium]
MSRLLEKSLIASLLLLASPLARANDSSYGGCSGLPSGVNGKLECVPLANDQIALIDEKLDIELSHRGAKIVARYTFENTGDATTVDVGFPLESPFGEEHDNGDVHGKAPLFPGYQVRLDGAAAGHAVFIPKAQGNGAAKKAATDFGYDSVFLVEVPFAKGQTRVLEHHYETGASLVAYAYTPFRYILRTGANWKGGKIGKIAITVRVQEPLTGDCHGASIPGMVWSVERRAFEFSATNWRPSIDLRVTYSPSLIAAHIRVSSLETMPAADELLALSDAALDEKLAALPPKELLSLYSDLLAIHHLKKPTSKPNSELCDTDLKALRYTWKRDPNVTLATLPPWVSKLLVRAAALLEARKVKVEPLPPA